MALAPADRVGLTHKGRIEVGADADLTVLAPDEEFVVDVTHPGAQEPGVGVRRQATLGRGTTNMAPRRACRTGRAIARQVPGERTTMNNYYAPQGGLPPQTRLTTDRSRFNEAYVVLPRGSMTDIVSSWLPFWTETRLWVLARPLVGIRRDLQPVPDGGVGRRRQ